MFDGLSLYWSWQPATLVAILILSLLYLLGVWRARRRSPQAVTILHLCSFFGAMLLLLFLLVSPLNGIGRTQLFLAHALQIVLLTTVCAPLVLAGCPAEVLRPLETTPGVRTIMRFLVSPLVASLLFNITFLLWHAPRLYISAMSNADLYLLMMLMIFGFSLLHWFPLMGSLKEWRRMGYLLQALYAFLDGQPADLFAIVVAVSTVLIYPYAVPQGFVLSPLLDQILGGGVLLIPGVIDLVVMSPLFIRWLGQLEEKTRLADQKRLEEWAMEEDDEDEEDER